MLYAPLSATARDADSVIGVIGKEQQSIGRVRRAGQKHKVSIYRLELRGPAGEETIDGELVSQNTREDLIRRATNTGE